MTQHPDMPPRSATFLEVCLKTAALIQTFPPEELPLLDDLLRRLYAAPARRGRATVKIAPALAQERPSTLVADFLAQHTVPDRKGKIRTMEFLGRFSTWAREAGVTDCPTPVEVRAALVKAGYPKRKAVGQQVFSGLSWNAVPADQVMEGAIQ